MTSLAHIQATEAPAAATAFTHAMAAAVAAVTVVTTDGPAGRFGLTVSSMASVSADPPMLLVSINRRSPILDAIRANGVLGVNVLGVHQAQLADTFAGRPRSGAPYDFGGASWQPASSGVPLLADAAARFDCGVSMVVPAGTHALVIATVTEAHRCAAPALAYTRRGYARAAMLDQSPSSERHGGCGGEASSARRSSVVS